MQNEKQPAVEPATLEERARLEAYHDIRASLVIVNGFCQALYSSFQELMLLSELESTPALHEAATQNKTQTQASIQVDAQTQDQAQSNTEELQQDCIFYLSRLVKAVEQLNGRMDVQSACADSALSPQSPRSQNTG